MQITSSSYLNFSSYKSIEDQFIDDCLQIQHFRSKQDLIQTDIRLATENCISINQFYSQKDIGRWSIEESFVYLQVLKIHSGTKNIIRTLLQRLPKRIQSQIRAHHQKMLKKYGTRDQIIRCLDLQENYRLMEINRRLSFLDLKLQRLSNLSSDFLN